MVHSSPGENLPGKTHLWPMGPGLSAVTRGFFGPELEADRNTGAQGQKGAGKLGSRPRVGGTGMQGIWLLKYASSLMSPCPSTTKCHIVISPQGTQLHCLIVNAECKGLSRWLPACPSLVSLPSRIDFHTGRPWNPLCLDLPATFHFLSPSLTSAYTFNLTFQKLLDQRKYFTVHVSMLRWGSWPSEVAINIPKTDKLPFTRPNFSHDISNPFYQAW